MASRKLKNRANTKGIKIKSRDASGSVMDKKPLFSLQHLSGNYCITNCNRDHKAAFADRLHRLSQLTWKELFAAPRHGLGCEKINNVTPPIPNVANGKKLLAFRYHDRNPIIGFQENEIFHILFVDRDFSVYEH